MNQPTPEIPTYDVVVVGAGFAGMYAVIRARRDGRSVLGFEAADGVGGVWTWNRYPGARCDVESVDYSYSFDEELQQDWVWSERYATQPEILRYAEHVAERHDVLPHFRFGQRVVSAHYDDQSATWTVGTDQGETVRGRHVLLATGSLSAPHLPDIAGIDTFAGEILMTASWPEGGADLAGKRVGVIGTGSSGVQSIPIIAEAAAELTVFQRSANYSVPVLNKDLSSEALAELKQGYAQRRATSWASPSGTPHTPYAKGFYDVDEDERRAAFEARWAEGGVLFGKVFDAQTVDPVINQAARDFVADKIRSVVADPQTAEDLVPTDHPIGTKRICTDSGYYETFNRDHVRLVNLRRDPITEITPWGVKTATESFEIDVLVLATGFDAMTGAMTRIDVVGPRGDVLADAWAEGPVTHLGLLVPGFPNLYSINGPGSPSVLANMVLSAEQHVDYVMDMIGHLDEHGWTSVEARTDAAEAWTTLVGEMAHKTLFPQANSWYMGANVEGKPRVFMPWIGGFKTYIDRLEEAREQGYPGLVLSA